MFCYGYSVETTAYDFTSVVEGPFLTKERAEMSAAALRRTTPGGRFTVRRVKVNERRL